MTTTAQVAQFASAKRQLESGLPRLFADLLIAPLIVLARRSCRSGGDDTRTAGYDEMPARNRLVG